MEQTLISYFHRPCPEASSILNFHILSGWVEEILHHQGKKKKKIEVNITSCLPRAFFTKNELASLITSSKGSTPTACVWPPYCLRETVRRSCSMRSKFMTLLQNLGK